jgi:predicted metalloendopeptidase
VVHDAADRQRLLQRSLNEIVFPASVLQPPMFDPRADDAANYGAIGAVIGHEISHGFDDAGSQFDGTGNLRVWWTDEDRKRFDAKTRIARRAVLGVLAGPGYTINGEPALGENIADNSGSRSPTRRTTARSAASPRRDRRHDRRRSASSTVSRSRTAARRASRCC